MSRHQRTMLLKRQVPIPEVLVSWPLVDSEVSPGKNIFQSENTEMFPGGPQFSEKGLINRSIVGKPEVFDKMHNAASNSIKFMKDVNLQSVQQVAKKLKRNMADSSASSSHRKISDYQGSTGVVNGGANTFDIKEKYDILKIMKKTSDLLQENERIRKEQLDKLNISQKIIETHDERVLSRFEQQCQQWDKVQKTIRRRQNNRSTLVEQQADFRNRIESLKLLESLGPEESRNPAISWHMRLRDPYSPNKQIQKEAAARTSLKNQLITLIPRRKHLNNPNPVKLVSEVSYFDKERSISDYKELRLNGESVMQREMHCLKSDGSPFSQHYYFYKLNDKTEQVG